MRSVLYDTYMLTTVQSDSKVENYLSAGESIRNLSQIDHEVLMWLKGDFKVARVPAPGVNGYRFWLANDKGFLWEPLAGETPQEAADNAVEFMSWDPDTLEYLQAKKAA